MEQEDIFLRLDFYKEIINLKLETMNDNMKHWNESEENKDKTSSNQIRQYLEEEGLEEGSLKLLEIYNHEISLEENYERSEDLKYILIQVSRNGSLDVMSSTSDPILSPSDKFMVRMDQFEDYGFDTWMVDYDTIFGTRFSTFMKYDSNFFSCDERVFFEALLIKYKKSDFKTFYWSKQRVFDEIGVKKDRTDAIIKKFIALGILTVKKKTRQHNGRPEQVNYFYVKPSKIIELLPQIFLESAEFNFITHRDITTYLKPGLSNFKRK